MHCTNCTLCSICTLFIQNVHKFTFSVKSAIKAAAGTSPSLAGTQSTQSKTGKQKHLNQSKKQIVEN